MVYRSESMAKRQKSEAVPTQAPSKAGGLQRSASMRTLRNRSVESDGQRKHTRGLSGDRNIRPRSGTNTSKASEPSSNRKHARGLSGDRITRQRRDSSSSNTSESDKQKAAGMTIPTTPNVLKYDLL